MSMIIVCFTEKVDSKGTLVAVLALMQRVVSGLGGHGTKVASLGLFKELEPAVKGSVAAGLGCFRWSRLRHVLPNFSDKATTLPQAACCALLAFKSTFALIHKLCPTCRQEHLAKTAGTFLYLIDGPHILLSVIACFTLTALGTGWAFQATLSASLYSTAHVPILPLLAVFADVRARFPT